MRNKKRIKPILKAIEGFWNLYPDLRLGQLISVLSGQQDPFNIEDDQMMKNLLYELKIEQQRRDNDE